MSRIRKSAVVKWFSLFSVVLVAFILLIFSWLYTTESGLQWLTARIAPFQPQALRLANISGTLSTQVRLEEFEWQQAEVKVRATELVLDCQWLHLIDGLVSCNNVALTSLSVSTLGEEKSQSGEDVWPELTSVKLPIAVNVKQASIANINYQQLNEKNSTAYDVSGLKVNKLILARSKISAKSISLIYDDHNIVASGFVDMRKQWQHQFDLTVVGPNLAASAKSKGSIAKLSQLTLQLQSPYKIELTADWFMDRGLFLKRGKLTAEKQKLELANDTLDIEQANGKFALNWPTLTSSLQVQTAWQEFENIELNVNAELTNVLSWQSNSMVSLRLASELSEQQILLSLPQVLPSETKGTKPHPTQVWPVSVNLDMTVAQGIITVKSQEIALGELSASLEGEFSAQNPLAENFSLKGQVNGRSFALKDSLQLANVNAHWQIEKQQSQWLISSEGKINKFALAQFGGQNINWAVDVSKTIQADIQADSLKIDTVDIKNPSLNMAGLPEKHRVKLSAAVADNASVKIAFDGKLLAEQGGGLTSHHDLAKAIWQINNLDFNTVNQGKNLVLAAEQLTLSRARQSVDNLCLKGSGTLCVNARHNPQQWAANLAFEQWSVSSVIEHLRTWQAILPVQYPEGVQGIVTGKLSLLGQDEKLEKITANLSIPSFKWRELEWQLQGEEFVINSQQQGSDLVVNTQWQNVMANVALPEWQSDIKMPKGTLALSLTPDFKVNFGLEQPDITLSLPREESEAKSTFAPHFLKIPLLSLTGQWQQNKISTRLQVLLPAEDKISAQFSSDWPLTDAARISGALSLNLQQFDWLKQWQKRIDKVDAALVQDFTLAGTWQKPLLEGQGALEIQQLVIDEYGLDIRNSKVKLNSKQDTIVLLGELKNPQGTLSIAGQAKLSTPLTANLTVEGQQVTLVNNSENKLIVSPKLQATYQNKHLDVDGHLVIEQADVKISSLPKSAISVSEDQVIADEKNVSTTDSPFDYNVLLTISAGNNVKVSGFGLSSEIQGDLSSSLISGQTLTLNGRLDLQNGKFEAYKQVLTIEEGQLLFLGAAENPSIQFRAIRIVDEIKVGIIADGTIHNPRLTLFSEPVLADENVLSLLITGRNLDSLSKQEGNALTSAAISLGVESANKLVQKVGDQLGLKDVAFTSKNGTNGSSTRVDLEAKINDRLNVGYGTNIDSDNSLQAGWSIEYKLSPNISFEATSGEEISANINYKKQYSPSKEKRKEKVKEQVKEQDKE